MILRGLKSAYLITRGLGLIGQLVEQGRRVVSQVKKYLIRASSIKSVSRHNTVRKAIEPISTIKAYFKRR